MGNKTDKVHVSKSRIMDILEKKQWSIATLARATLYSREHLSRSINNGLMSRSMLEIIAEVLRVNPLFLRGIDKVVYDDTVKDFVKTDFSQSSFQDYEELNHDRNQLLMETYYLSKLVYGRIVYDKDKTPYRLIQSEDERKTYKDENTIIVLPENMIELSLRLNEMLGSWAQEYLIPLEKDLGGKHEHTESSN